MSTQTLTRPTLPTRITEPTYTVLVTVETATKTEKRRAVKKATSERVAQIKARLRREAKRGDVFEILLINEHTGTQTFA